MKDLFERDEINFSPDNPTFEQVLQANLSRRQILKGGLGLAVVSMFGGGLTACNGDDDSDTPVINFQSVAISTEDKHVVPKGYTGKVLYRWGDPVSNGAEFKYDASNSAAEQSVQAGMHHDGMHYFPIDLLQGGDSSLHGLLAINHEYIEPALLHTTGGYSDDSASYTQEKANKELAAHGVSIIEVKLENNNWSVVRPSKYGRRITMTTAMTLSGPAAGSRLLKTKADSTGKEVFGTLNNCANGFTPWGTYLTCEENFQEYFVIDDKTTLSTETQAIVTRDAVPLASASRLYFWDKHYDRFNVNKEPNEVNRFGWVVEIDPFDSSRKPIKRTALGRCSHENAAYTLTSDNRVVVYMGDDKRFEFIYKFVSRRAYDKNNRAANMAAGTGILDDGDLYVARFDADGSGVWLPLKHGAVNPKDSTKVLDAAAGFNDLADVLVKARTAATLMGATPMDRPEWFTIDAKTGYVYGTLTNNSRRGTTGNAGTDAANPRAVNDMGHIIRWKENGSADATSFKWDIFVLAGNPASSKDNYKGNIKGDIFSCPDGLHCDKDGRLWIQTDMSDTVMLDGEYVAFGNNQMLCANTTTGEIRRFFTGPVGCEVTGITRTPDGKNMFINVQHPGDIPKGLVSKVGSERVKPSNPRATSNWPDFKADGRPRSSTIVITKDDGGIVGT